MMPELAIASEITLRVIFEIILNVVPSSSFCMREALKEVNKNIFTFMVQLKYVLKSDAHIPCYHKYASKANICIYTTLIHFLKGKWRENKLAALAGKGSQ